MPMPSAMEQAEFRLDEQEVVCRCFSSDHCQETSLLVRLVTTGDHFVAKAGGEVSP